MKNKWLLIGRLANDKLIIIADNVKFNCDTAIFSDNNGELVGAFSIHTWTSVVPLTQDEYFRLSTDIKELKGKSEND